jgi:hypothetical protein
MEMNTNLGVTAELSCILIHADGRRENLGVVSRAGKVFRQFVKAVRRLLKKLDSTLGRAVAVAIIYALTMKGLMPWQTLPVLGIVTTAGVNYMAADFRSGGVTPTISGFKFHDSGTGTNGAVVGDTVLQTPTGIARVSGTPTGATNQYISTATIAYNNTFAVTEWGLFSASSSGTLWDRRTFTAINVVNGDSIQFAYTLTVNNGGT